MIRNRILAASAFLCIALFSLSGQSKIQLKIASMAPSRSPWDIEQRALAQEWFEITKGQVSITYYDATSLGGEKAIIQKFRSVRPGQKSPLDGGIFTTIGLHELAPDAAIYTLSIPFLIRNQNELNRILEQFGPDIINEYRKAGYEMIAWTNVGWLSFYTKEPFSNLAELKKIKIASAGLDSPILGESFSKSGFIIEDVTAAKLLQSLKSTGGVRGFFGVHMFAYVTGLSKTISYGLDAKLCPVVAGLFMSNDAWAKIPAEFKPEMLKAVERMRIRLDAALEQTDRTYVDNMKKDGVTMIVPSDKELAAWETDFGKDIEAINRALPGAFSMPLFHKIQNVLQTSRK